MDFDYTGEIWNPHPSFPVDCSTYGRIRNQKTGHIYKTNQIYRHIVIYTPEKTKKKIHHLMYETFYGEIPDGLDVLHYDEYLPQPFINSHSNLSLGTDSINSHDRFNKNRGWRPTGEKNPRGHLTEEDVREMRRLWGTRDPNLPHNSRGHKITGKFLSEKYGITIQNVSKIIKGTLWSHIPLEGG
jgi:hypothetical protein